MVFNGPPEASFIDSKLNAPVNFKAYGLGWSMMDFSGQKIVLHNGGLDGVTSQLFLIPSKNIGVIMLCNKTTVLPIIMMYQLLDRFINKSQRSWSTELSVMINKYKSVNHDMPKYEDVEKVNNEFYIGTYYDSLVGKTVIKNDSGQLIINCNESTLLKGILKPIGMLEFELSLPLMPSLPKGKIEFDVNAIGEVSGFKINLPNPDMHFDELYFKKQK
ncbi:MAG: hypothetical protein B6243_03625 [Anaerolineaceae bacterium 4572_5.2]|nr:MAG: hypothetical protein B6243_03625 [Anaerolineaceae bacterium 4572_5.2]